MKRDKKGRFCKKITKKENLIAKQLDTKRGRKVLAKAMVEPIRNAIEMKAVGLPPDWGRKSVTVNRSKPKVQHRPTMEEIQSAKEKEARRLLNRRGTINKLGLIAREASRTETAYRENLFGLSLRSQMGNAKLNEELKEIQDKETALQLEYDNEINGICGCTEYKNAKSTLLKEMRKTFKGLYAQAQKKYGNKMTKVLFHKSMDELKAVCKFPAPINKNLIKAKKELEAKLEEIEHDKKIVAAELEKAYDAYDDHPRITPEDLSFNDHSNMIGKKRVQLPGDDLSKNGIDIRDFVGMDLEGLEVEDLDVR